MNRLAQTSDIKQYPNKTISMEKAQKRHKYGIILYSINKNLLAISTMIMILISLGISIMLKETTATITLNVNYNDNHHERHHQWTSRQLMKLKFIGELFIRILLSLIVPLVSTSIAYACTGFDPKSSGKIIWEILIFYLLTTTLASITGLFLVMIIKPGKRVSYHQQHQHYSINQTTSTSDTLNQPPILMEDTILDMFRNLFTDSIFRSLISTYHTILKPPKNGLNETDLNKWDILYEQLPEPNIMSIVLISLLLGISVNLIKTPGSLILINLIELLNKIIMMVTLIIVQTAPVCTSFLIIPQILKIDDLTQMFQLIGWFTLTVLLSLSTHCFITLSSLYFFYTGKNPFQLFSQMSSAISTAFATSSSSATMAITMKCLEKKAKLNPNIVKFVIPFGSTINMDGAALYESIAAIFVAQYRNKPLHLSNLLTITITSILVSIGAGGIPQAGMITTVVVLKSIGLSLEDAALIMVVDFLLDRFRTVVNVLGDAFGAAIVDARLKNYHTSPRLLSSSSSLLSTTELENGQKSSSFHSSSSSTALSSSLKVPKFLKQQQPKNNGTASSSPGGIVSITTNTNTDYNDTNPLWNLMKSEKKPSQQPEPEPEPEEAAVAKNIASKTAPKTPKFPTTTRKEEDDLYEELFSD